MLSDYKLLIIEMTKKEFDEILSGVREVHGLSNLSDEQVEQYIKDLIYAELDHRYVAFREESASKQKALSVSTRSTSK